MTAFEAKLGSGKVLDTSCLSGAADGAMLSHDIRAALNSVLGGVSLMDTSTLPAEASLQVERVRAASNILASLIAQAIGDECVDGDADVQRRKVTLGDFTEFLMQRWKGEALSRDIAFEVVAEGDLPVALDCPAVELSRMVGNLVSNSIRHGPSASIVVRIRRPRQGGVELEVRDKGPGVRDSVLRTLSRPGFGSRLRAEEQHGIGLQIVRVIATEFGGRFSLRNDPEGGAIASIWLPDRYCIWDVQTDPWTNPARSHTSFPALAGLRVLLAEDNPTNQMVASQMLEALRAEVTVSSDGVEALDAFAAGSFDLVIVDIEMPRLSGLDVIRSIRALPDERARVPIVALTAYALREHRERITAAGANGLISKPVTGIEDLGRSLSAHLSAPRDRRKPAPGRAGAPYRSFETEVAATAIDKSTYDSLVATIGPEMRDELLEKVMADLVGARKDLDASLSTLDLLPVRAASHILISVGGAIGASTVLATARAVNSRANETDIDRLPGEIRDCIAALDQAIGFVKDEHEKMKD